ncbi:MAG: type I-C CRISPR-associated protein Cas5c [Nitrosospira sp.]|nr:type I-C CRISPR-associated protein Cas5c [Nitrosospira sp.]MDN5934681.1 type I-C CRISPR-associated protein Cas5c [Nitrosospira sp.]
MKTYCLEVTGDFACFTRPEMKVERVSYDVMTPSAARAVFESILWKPAIHWHITKIEVLKPIKWISVRRNEVAAVAIIGKDGIFADEPSVRQQRAGLFLRDVAYRIHAHFELRDSGFHKSNYPYLSKRKVNQNEDDLAVLPDNNAPKFMSMFERRARKGQCVNQPYLGCREFAANFRLVENSATIQSPAIVETRDLGWMLYDLDYGKSGDHPQPLFFNARLRNGELTGKEVDHLPAWDSGEVRG